MAKKHHKHHESKHEKHHESKHEAHEHEVEGGRKANKHHKHHEAESKGMKMAMKAKKAHHKK